MTTFHYRRAVAADLDALLALEQTFPGDRLSRRSFRRLLKRPSAEIWVCVRGDAVMANAVVLHRRGAASARLYSIVVAEEARGQGIAKSLVQAVEAAAARRGCRSLHLEVRVDNTAALALYQRLGYRPTRVLSKFYEDGQDGLRLERDLVMPRDIAA